MKASRLVSELVPNPLNQVRGQKPKEAQSHHGQPGKGKTGRVNVSEPLMRPRNRAAAETMAEYGGGSMEHPRAYSSGGWTPQLRGKGGTHPSRISTMRNVGTPMEASGGRYAGRPTATAADFSSGNRMVQEAKAGSRKATGRHNRPDRAWGWHGGTTDRNHPLSGARVRVPPISTTYPTRKGADVDQGSHPTIDVTSANRWKS